VPLAGKGAPMHEFHIIVQDNDDSRVGEIDDTVRYGRAETDKAIQAFRDKYQDRNISIKVWNETRQRPARGWNDEYR
jgi:hypothetical protein